MAERYTESPFPLLIPSLGKTCPDTPSAIERTAHTFRTNGIRHMSDVILILAAQSVIFTTEEVMSFFHGNMRSAEYAISTLKDGTESSVPLLQSGSFGFKQGQARNYYTVTDEGLEMASERLNGHFFNERATGTSASKTIHTYGTGMNVFQAFLTGFPFRTKREAPPKGQKYTDADKLFTDVVLYFFPEEPKKMARIFVEEDTGSEARDILVDKLRKYALSDCMAEKMDCVLFSFFCPRVGSHPYREVERKGLKGVVYSEKELRPLLSGMNGAGSPDAFDFYIGSGLKSPVLDDFLLSLNAAGQRNGELVKGPHAVTPAFLEAYIAAGKSLQNPYVISGINSVHVDMAHENLKMFAEAFSLPQNRGEPFLRAIRTGFQVYCVATPLACDAMRFAVLQNDTELQQIIGRTLGKGFSYAERLAPAVDGQRGKAMLRNIFVGTGGKKIAFEPACFDAGTWYRLWTVTRSDGVLSCPVICLFDTMEQARRFYTYLGERSYDGENKIYGLLYRDLGKPGRVFCPVVRDGVIDYFLCDLL